MLSIQMKLFRMRWIDALNNLSDCDARVGYTISFTLFGGSSRPNYISTVNRKVIKVSNNSNLQVSHAVDAVASNFDSFEFSSKWNSINVNTIFFSSSFLVSVFPFRHRCCIRYFVIAVNNNNTLTSTQEMAMGTTMESLETLLGDEIHCTSHHSVKRNSKR